MPANPQVTDELVEKAARILLNRMFAFNTWESAPSDAKEICKINAKDCLTAALADHVVVPREPTDAMLDAGAFALVSGTEVEACYRAMISAASPLVSQEG
jgi:hypothetical protein